MFPYSDGSLPEVIADAVIGIDREGTIVFWGSGAQAMLGYTRDETVGQAFAELLVPADRIAHHLQALQETLTSGATACRSVRKSKDGSLIEVDATLTALRQPPAGAAFVLSNEKFVGYLPTLNGA